MMVNAVALFAAASWRLYTSRAPARRSCAPPRPGPSPECVFLQLVCFLYWQRMTPGLRHAILSQVAARQLLDGYAMGVCRLHG